MGTVSAGGDMSHNVGAGQAFVMRSKVDSFRTMVQIDEAEEDASHQFKITFINIMGESADSVDIHYG